MAGDGEGVELKESEQDHKDTHVHVWGAGIGTLLYIARGDMDIKIKENIDLEYSKWHACGG